LPATYEVLTFYVPVNSISVAHLSFLLVADLTKPPFAQLPVSQTLFDRATTESAPIFCCVPWHQISFVLPLRAVNTHLTDPFLLSGLGATLDCTPRGIVCVLLLLAIFLTFT